jgi:hypothetical protein
VYRLTDWRLQHSFAIAALAGWNSLFLNTHFVFELALGAIDRKRAAPKFVSLFQIFRLLENVPFSFAVFKNRNWKENEIIHSKYKTAETCSQTCMFPQ